VQPVEVKQTLDRRSSSGGGRPLTKNSITRPSSEILNAENIRKNPRKSPERKPKENRQDSVKSTDVQTEDTTLLATAVMFRDGGKKCPASNAPEVILQLTDKQFVLFQPVTMRKRIVSRQDVEEFMIVVDEEMTDVQKRWKTEILALKNHRKRKRALVWFDTFYPDFED
jgi:hypothetical protein